MVLHPQNTSQTEMFAYAARDNSSAPTANTSIHGVPKGSHTVLVFDGEQNGLLSTRAAAVQNVTVAEGGPAPARSNSSPYVCNYNTCTLHGFCVTLVLCDLLVTILQPDTCSIVKSLITAC